MRMGLKTLVLCTAGQSAWFAIQCVQQVVLLMHATPLYGAGSTRNNNQPPALCFLSMCVCPPHAENVWARRAGVVIAHAQLTRTFSI